MQQRTEITRLLRTLSVPSTHHIEDGEKEEEVVKDAMDLLPGERVDGRQVAQEPDNPDDQDQNPLRNELKVGVRVGVGVDDRTRTSGGVASNVVCQRRQRQR